MFGQALAFLQPVFHPTRIFFLLLCGWWAHPFLCLRGEAETRGLGEVSVYIDVRVNPSSQQIINDTRVNNSDGLFNQYTF